MSYMMLALACSIVYFAAVIHRPSAWADERGGQGSDTQKAETSLYPIGNPQRGAQLYQASCIVCHGPGAMGKIGPRLAGNPVLKNEQAFWKIVYEGRHVMPPLKDAVSEQQLADILAWLKTLS
jgi:cytochrome c oxidase cbb3-type subunit III